MRTLFQSRIDTIGNIPGIRPVDEISIEPAFFSCSPEFILSQNCPLHIEILNAIRNTYTYKAAKNAALGLNELVDSRITQTMKGMYPSIPGWHCDNVPRNKDYNQPNLDAVDDRVQHFMCYLSSSAEHSDTEFAVGEYSIDINKSDVWGSLDRALVKDPPMYHFCKEGEIVRFNQESIHRASPTLNPGWRLWLRLCFVNRPIRNVIRKQVQVYTSINGW